MAGAGFCLPKPGEIRFQKHELDLGSSEALTIADIDKDGRLDIVSGENWYQAPSWTKHRFRDLQYLNNDLIDDFSDLALDVDKDGYVDIVSCLGSARKLVWMENPGSRGGIWKEHVVEDGGYGIEFAFLADLDNDGRREEVLPMLGWKSRVPVAWYERKDQRLVRHIIGWKSHDHGIGWGDVNGDGRSDVLIPRGWYEAPINPRQGEWKFHPSFELGNVGFIHVIDVNGDGINDIVTAKAHDYGIFWMEQDADGGWTRHMIDDTWAQAHATTLVDVNGDGQLDLLTGKRYLAHNGRDPGDREPLGIYWYEYRRSENSREIQWVRHVIDYSTRAGGGLQIPAWDADGDGDLDFAVGGRSGLYLFENLGKPTISKTR